MSNEEGYFEIYWALSGQKIWERTRIPSDPLKPPAGWGHGFKDVAQEAWMARASLHVTGDRSGEPSQSIGEVNGA